ncbi:hypothetical protein AVEN_68977-1 [Araneus ventricosus]|uniref:Uncharacterized protein n=1 Tax=Araneus ventricosus TaxID=182803 RepID=A0A4Y2WGM2_ARAVE|nr:hypothetical protein AVEN_68977-1 [Araneus ventricosus]
MPMRIKLRATALNSERYGESDHAVADIAPSVLKDIGLLTKTDTSQVVDRYEIRREKSHSRNDKVNRTPSNYVVFILTKEKIIT